MDHNISAKLQLLQENYRQELPLKLKRLAGYWHQYETQHDLKTLEECKFVAHKLAGSAGTYGYPLISKLARAIEEAIVSGQVALVAGYIADLQQVKLELPQISAFDAEIVENEAEDAVKKIYILDYENARERYANINTFYFSYQLFLSADTFITALYEVKPDIVIIHTDYAEAITAEILSYFKEHLVIVIYTAEKDELNTRLATVRHGGQLFLPRSFDATNLSNYINNLLEAKRISYSKILIMDDSVFLSNYYELLFKQANMRTAVVNDPQQFLGVVQEFQPDLILMDINMPYCNGVELAQIVHQQESLNAIPIIFLSTISEKNKQLDALSYAGDDFLTKPIQPKQLLSAVSNRLVRSRILRMRLMRDSLTNLLNHTMIFHQLERELILAERYHKSLAVVLIDIDHFKQVNDSYGHQAGDQVLQNLSLFLQKHLRKSDIIGRYGGEEFLIVLPETKIDTALQIVDQLRIKFSEMTHHLNAHTVQITFSAGIGAYPAISTTEAIVRAADEALYSAKRAGRNRVAIA